MSKLATNKRTESKTNRKYGNNHINHALYVNIINKCHKVATVAVAVGAVSASDVAIIQAYSE